MPCRNYILEHNKFADVGQENQLTFISTGKWSYFFLKWPEMSHKASGFHVRYTCLATHLVYASNYRRPAACPPYATARGVWRHEYVCPLTDTCFTEAKALNQWSACRRDCYLHNTNKRKRRASIPSAGFEPSIPAIRRSQTHALDGTATGIGQYIL
jgi:hypothetical protein